MSQGVVALYGRVRGQRFNGQAGFRVSSLRCSAMRARWARRDTAAGVWAQCVTDLILQATPSRLRLTRWPHRPVAERGREIADWEADQAGPRDRSQGAERRLRLTQGPAIQ
jgi:hypothetical protein